MARLEYKTAGPVGIKPGAGGHGQLAGYGSVWERVDLVGDTVRKGAFARSLPGFVRDGFLSWGHDVHSPIATVDAAREDERGLWLEASFHSHPDAQRARQIASERLARGKSMGLSIGFSVPAGGARRRQDGVRELSEITLLEVSLVTVPAEPLAQVASVKASGRSVVPPAAQRAVRAYAMTWLKLNGSLPPWLLEAALDRRPR